MGQIRFCSKCGASLLDADERCRLCRTAVADMVVVAVKASTPSDGSPFVTMWLQPRDTIRGILNSNPSYLVIPLAAVSGIFQTLSRAADRSAGDLLSLQTVLLIAVVAGAIAGIIGLYLGSLLLYVTGRWIGGTAAPKEIRASLAWGSVPAVWGGLLWIPILALAGREVFMSDMEATDASAGLLLVAAGMLFVQVGTYIWSFFTGLHSLGEAQGFSAWRAFGNYVLAFLIVFVPIIALAIGLPALLVLTRR